MKTYFDHIRLIFMPPESGGVVPQEESVREQIKSHISEIRQFERSLKEGLEAVKQGKGNTTKLTHIQIDLTRSPNFEGLTYPKDTAGLDEKILYLSQLLLYNFFHYHSANHDLGDFDYHPHEEVIKLVERYLKNELSEGDEENIPRAIIKEYAIASEFRQEQPSADAHEIL